MSHPAAAARRTPRAHFPPARQVDIVALISQEKHCSEIVTAIDFVLQIMSQHKVEFSSPPISGLSFALTKERILTENENEFTIFPFNTFQR